MPARVYNVLILVLTPLPPQVPLEIYELMLAAWQAEGGRRPAFADMRQKTLDPLVSAGPGMVLTMS
jgi:hypothetical protein